MLVSTSLPFFFPFLQPFWQIQHIKLPIDLFLGRSIIVTPQLSKMMMKWKNAKNIELGFRFGTRYKSQVLVQGHGHVT
jgi:hypothetical protein